MKSSQHQQEEKENLAILLMLGGFALIGGVCAIAVAFPITLPFIGIIGIALAKVMSHVTAMEMMNEVTTLITP